MLITLRTERVLTGAVTVAEVCDGSVWILSEAGRVSVVPPAADPANSPATLESVVEAEQGATHLVRAFSGRRVFLGDREGLLRCYDAESRELLRNCSAHGGGIASLTGGRDDVVSAGAADGLVKVYRAQSGILRDVFEVDVDVTAVAPAADGSVLVGTRDGRLLSLSSAGCEDVLLLEGSSVTALCTTVGTRPYTWLGLENGQVLCSRSREIVFSSHAHAGPVRSLCALSKHLVCSGGADGRVCLWNVHRSRVQLLHSAPAVGVRVALTAGKCTVVERRRVWIASEGAVRAWSLSSRTVEEVVEEPHNQFESRARGSGNHPKLECAPVQDALPQEPQSDLSADESKESPSLRITQDAAHRLTKQELERELQAALKLIKDMDESSRRSEDRIERLCTLLQRRSALLSERHQELQQGNGTLAQHQDCLRTAEADLRAVSARARDILEERKFEGSAIQQRMSAIATSRHRSSALDDDVDDVHTSTPPPSERGLNIPVMLSTNEVSPHAAVSTGERDTEPRARVGHLPSARSSATKAQNPASRASTRPTEHRNTVTGSDPGNPRR